MGFLSRFLGDANAREVKRVSSEIVEKVGNFESRFADKSDDELRARAESIRQDIRSSSKDIYNQAAEIIERKERRQFLRRELDKLTKPYEPEIFALVREASKRTIGLRHYDVQLIGGSVLGRGQIAEMSTGEGKTLVATLPLFLHSLPGIGVHLVTVNDYLARRDAGWMGPIYSFLGASVAVIAPNFSAVYDPSFKNDEKDERLAHLRPVSRQEAYQADIVYGTNNEFGFDYLRDNMAQKATQVVQRELYYAIVDEVDSILIDESRTPLIISSFSSESADYYRQFAEIMPKLKATQHYTIDEKLKTAALTSEGITVVEKALGIDNLFSADNAALAHYADTALRAQVVYRKNKDYVVKDGEVVIVDEFTGRMLTGRRYSSGLHQAIEAKEKVAIQQESVTLATITFQNYFRLYAKLSGMTGTAITEAEEFAKIYELDVTQIPTHRTRIRIDHGDEVYRTEEAKLKAVVGLVVELQKKGQPVLIGTVSIAKSERLSKLLKAARVTHQVLNAKQHQKEGEIISLAGFQGAVTVATNMAGRGVDIILGGPSPSSESKETEIDNWRQRHQAVIEAGGLYVIGTERHESRRIDNQLRGRAGRQGDPGETKFFLSMEDDLMRIFGGDRMKSLMTTLRVPDEMAIQNKILTRSIEQAQTKVEGHNFDQRKHLVQYDDVTNRHREAIYNRRRRALHAQENQAEEIHQSLLELMSEETRLKYEEKYQRWPSESRLEIERSVIVRTIDVLWVEHLKNLEALRDAIGLRGYSQKDPLIEYKQEAFNLYQNFIETLDRQIVETLSQVDIRQTTPSEPSTRPIFLSADQKSNNQKVSSGRVGRNDPCPCGAIDPKTGRVYKYKRCGLINAPWHQR